MEARVPARLTPVELRRFGLLVGSVFLALAAFWSWREHRIAAILAAALAVPLIVLGLAAPSMLGPVYRAWMAFALRLSKITTPILMGVVYYGVLTPIALAMRAAGRNPLVHDGADHGSFWKSRSPETRRSALDRKF